MININYEIPEELRGILKSPELRSLFVIAREKKVFYADDARRVYLSRAHMLNSLDYLVLHRIIIQIARDRYKYIYKNEEQNNNQKNLL